MRSESPIPLPSSRRRARRRLLALAVSPLAAVAFTAPTASAAGWADWYISFKDYAPTTADPAPDSVNVTTFMDDPSIRLYARVLRAGTEFAHSDVNPQSLRQTNVVVGDLRVGDVAQAVDGATGATVASATYDGRAWFRTTCLVGQSALEGDKVDGSQIYYVNSETPGAGTGPYAGYGQPNSQKSGTNYDGAGTTFGATFKRPLAAGDLLLVNSARPQVGNLIVATIVERQVTACDAAGSPSGQSGSPDSPSAAPGSSVSATATTGSSTDHTAPKGTAAAGKSPGRLKLADLAKKGLTFTVKTDEAATLRGTISLRTTTGKGKKRHDRLTVVGTANQALAAGQSTEVRLKTTTSVKSKLKKAAKAKGSKLVVVLTLTDAAGNVTTLPGTTLPVPKA